MGRLDQITTTIQPDIVERTVKNKPSEYDNTPRYLLVDADSLLFLCTHFPENSEFNIEFNTEELQLKEAIYRLNNKIQEIQINIEDCFNIKQTLLFIGGKDNFRYKIYPEYKSNRKDKKISPLVPLLKKHMIENMPNVIESHGAEADDYVYEANQIAKNNSVISSIDKDVHIWCSEVPLYDFRSYNSKELLNTIIVGQFKYTSKKESRLAIATQILTGDSTDNIKGAVKIGKAYCEKHLHKDMTDYQFIKAILKGYLKANNNDMQLAKKDMKLNYYLLKLWTKEEIKKINLAE